MVGALGGDGFVRPAYRRHGIGGALHQASRDALGAGGLVCMYGAPGAMNVTPLKRGGSREVGTVSRWARPVSLGVLAAPFAPLDALARAALRPRHPARLEPMRRNDPRVDEVWTASKQSLRICAVRDATFYTWRFLDGPSQREPPYVVLRGDRPIAACALEGMAGAAYLRVIDLLAVPGTFREALAAIAAHASAAGAHVVDVKLHTSDGRRRRLWQSGFVERDRKPFLVMIPKDGDVRLLDEDRWFYSGADSDLDALE